MSSDPQSDKRKQAAADTSAQGEDGEQQFTPEELKKAARAQVILYVVMAIMIIAPFIVLWLRKN